MTEQQLRIAQLIVQHLKGTLSGRERAELDNWLNTAPENRQLFESLTEDHALRQELARIDAVNRDDAWRRFREKIGDRPPVFPMKREKRLWWRVAAAIALLVALGWLIRLQWFRPDTGGSAQPATLAAAEIVPGGDKAMLQLADGTVIVLDSAANGRLASQGKATVLKSDGTLSYDAAVPGGEEIFNSISTPRGGQYKLVLADGSRVWLNSASSIRFPVAFTGEMRQVEITGEAYFEVSSNPKRPFRVHVQDGGMVEVLGTKFNVNAYRDEPSVKTSLLEGAVRVVAVNGSSVQLKPGQQAQTNESSKVIDDVDLDEILAWKEGWFSFDRADVGSIMRQVSRWYDVDVVFEGAGSGKTFSGMVSRSHDISEVLKIMEKAGVEFRIEGRRITVKQ